MLWFFSDFHLYPSRIFAKYNDSRISWSECKKLKWRKNCISLNREIALVMTFEFLRNLSIDTFLNFFISNYSFLYLELHRSANKNIWISVLQKLIYIYKYYIIEGISSGVVIQTLAMSYLLFYSKVLGPIYLQNTLLKPRYKNTLSI